MTGKGSKAPAKAPAKPKTIQDNPKYVDYFKVIFLLAFFTYFSPFQMLRIGVPAEQIKKKMAEKGCSAAEQALLGLFCCYLLVIVI